MAWWSRRLILPSYPRFPATVMATSVEFGRSATRSAITAA